MSKVLKVLKVLKEGRCETDPPKQSSRGSLARLEREEHLTMASTQGTHVREVS